MNCLLILNLVLSALRKLKRLTGVVVAQGVSSAVTSSKRMAWQWRLTNPKELCFLLAWNSLHRPDWPEESEICLHVPPEGED